jgi:hypothetical protein
LGTKLILLLHSTDWETPEAHHCDRNQELETVMTKMEENVCYATEIAKGRLQWSNKNIFYKHADHV